MRGAFEAEGAAETLADALWNLAERDGFYVNRESFEKELRFLPGLDGVRIEVYGELGENLLVWARQQGILTLKK